MLQIHTQTIKNLHPDQLYAAKIHLKTYIAFCEWLLVSPVHIKSAFDDNQIDCDFLAKLFEDVLTQIFPNQ